MNKWVSFFLCLFSFTATASVNHVATIVKIQGKVKLFYPNLTHPELKTAPHVLYEGQTFKVVDATLGQKIENGVVVSSEKNSKAKVVYNNGDQLIIAPNSQYVISWNGGKTQAESDPGLVKVIYGAIRMVVDKKGPRSGLKVKTASTAFVIRGTDFHVGQKGTSGFTQLSVLRGKVSAQTLSDKKEVSVTKGESAIVEQAQKPKAVVQQTSKEDLKQIALETKVKSEEAVPENLSKEIAKLEEKALGVTLADIKKDDPAFYEKIDQKKTKDSDQLNLRTVVKVFKVAPAGKGKPGWRDLDELEQDPYKKYFKPQP